MGLSIWALRCSKLVSPGARAEAGMWEPRAGGTNEASAWRQCEGVGAGETIVSFTRTVLLLYALDILILLVIQLVAHLPVAIPGGLSSSTGA